MSEAPRELPAELGPRIAVLRGSKHWTQLRLCAETGIEQSRMSKFEHGRSKPYFHEMQRIARALEQPLCLFDTLSGVEYLIVPKGDAAHSHGAADRQPRTSGPHGSPTRPHA